MEIRRSAKAKPPVGTVRVYVCVYVCFDDAFCRIVSQFMLILKANVLLLGWIEAERQQQQKLQTMARELSARRTEHYVNKFNILLTTKRPRMAL